MSESIRTYQSINGLAICSAKNYIDVPRWGLKLVASQDSICVRARKQHKYHCASQIIKYVDESAMKRSTILLSLCIKLTRGNYRPAPSFITGVTAHVCMSVAHYL